MDQLKCLKDCVSPIQWLLMWLVIIPPTILLFRPSLFELVLVIIVDSTMAFIAIKTEAGYFMKRHPDTALYYERVDEEKIKHLSRREKLSLYISMSNFPLLRTKKVFLHSYPKIVPAWIVIIFIWEYEGSMLKQALLVVLFSTYFNCLFCQAVFVESHIYLSRIIKELHEKYDWSDVFLHARIPQSKVHYRTIERFNLISLFIMMLIMQAAIFFTEKNPASWEFFLKIIVVGVITLIFMERMFNLGRKLIYGGIEDLFKAIDALDYKVEDDMIPLHTIELLSKCEKSYNNLASRLKASEQELSLKISREEEKSRILTANQEQLRKVSSELAAAEERERRRIATDLHDSVSQTLGMCSSRLKNLLSSDEKSNSTDGLNEICTYLDQAIRDTRSLTFELSPPILYDFGLEAALEWLTEDAADRYGISTAFRDDGASKPLTEVLKVILYRSTRELLINTIKHARAERVDVSVYRDEQSIGICVRDDGDGFNGDSNHRRKPNSFGLFSIRERLEPLGGILQIQSEPGKGAMVTLSAPLDPPQTG